MRDIILTALEADTALMAALTGGLYGATEISRQTTPDAFNAAAEVLPCGLVAMEVETPIPPHRNGSRLFFTVTFYERTGYTNIDVALTRAFVVLHDVKVGAASDGVWQVLHAEDSADLEDPALRCSMRYARFVAYRLRS